MSYPEGPDYYANAYKRNRQFAKPSATNYQTQLNPQQESAFRNWLHSSGASEMFDPNARVVDYDMRGYWLETGGKGWKPGSHFPDTYKTPYDTTFSNQSKYATPDNPFTWRGDVLTDKRTGKDVGPTPESPPKRRTGGAVYTPNGKGAATIRPVDNLTTPPGVSKGYQSRGSRTAALAVPSVRAPAVAPRSDEPEIDHYAIGHAHGVAMGRHIQNQVTEALKRLPGELMKHIQTELGKQGLTLGG
jgi:hypothetical protein